MTPSAKSEETLVPSQSVIGEIKMACILRTETLPDSPTRGLRVTCQLSTPGTEAAVPVKVQIGGKKFGVGCVKKSAVEKGCALASQTVIGEIKLRFLSFSICARRHLSWHATAGKTESSS